MKEEGKRGWEWAGGLEEWWSHCVALWAAPCVSDSGCEYTWPRTGLLRDCIAEWELSVSGHGMGGMLALTARQFSHRGSGPIVWAHTML